MSVVPFRDIGLMQVNRNVWRGLYDVKGLGADYNANGGSRRSKIRVDEN
jgi:hypothetical protein